MSESSWPGGVRLPFPSQPGRERPLSPRLLAAAEPILQVAGIGAWFYRDGGELWWSAETRRIHGVSADFVVTREAALAFCLPEHRQALLDGLNAALVAGSAWDIEMGIVRPDGQRRQVRARGQSAAAHDGQPAALLGTFEDITARFEAANRAARGHYP